MSGYTSGNNAPTLMAQAPNRRGNISKDPQLASTSHLSAASPCRGAGSASYASGTDIDGEDWAEPPSIGCDEVHAGAIGGPLIANIGATFTNVATGLAVEFAAPCAHEVCEALAEVGVLAKDTHEVTVRLAPPLVITEGELDAAIDRWVPVFRRYAQG